MNLLPDGEWTTTVELGLWLAMASKIGNRGSEDTILVNCETARLMGYNWADRNDLRKRKGVDLFTENISKDAEMPR